MSEICKTCGLPKELCACEDIAKETQGAIRIYTDRRRYGKFVTLINGIQSDSVGGDMDAFMKKLKTHCACGGSHKAGEIMLQGDQKKKVQNKLRSMGFVIGE